jgi:hypothetical protein
LFIFASIFKDALEIGFTRNEEASRGKSQQRFFTLFFAVSMGISRLSKFVFFKTKFPINYKNKRNGERKKDAQV